VATKTEPLRHDCAQRSHPTLSGTSLSAIMPLRYATTTTSLITITHTPPLRRAASLGICCVERVMPQMKATFPLWSTVCLSACYLLASPNPAFINVRLPLTTTKTTTVVGVPPRGRLDAHREPPDPFLFLFFLPFSDRFIYHILFRFFIPLWYYILYIVARLSVFCPLLAFPTGGLGSVIKAPFFSTFVPPDFF
jgi:hypothetical protein